MQRVEGIGVTNEADRFDYIVVGAGSAGSAIAGILAQTGRHRVLVLEAGPGDRRPEIQMPIGYGLSFYNPRVNWMYRTEPVPGLDNRPIYQPRGKIVGGSGSINAMVYARGHASDFDGWLRQGNPGWGWADVLDCYRRMENHALGESAWHGADGPLRISDITREVHPLTHTFVKAAQETGLPHSPDLNGDRFEGVGYYQINTDNGLRMSSARAWLWPPMRRGLVEVATGSEVDRIVFEGRRAVGVVYRRGGRTEVARAAAEVIVSAGAFNSPKLLQLSGVGPAGLLKQHGIGVVCDCPAVGEHMQDHLCYDHAYRSNVPTLNYDLGTRSGQAKAMLRYLLRRRGPLSLSVNQGGGFMRSRPDVAVPDIQLYFSPLSYERAPPGVRKLMRPDPFPGFLTSVSPCRPTSRGSVRIASSDPTRPPRIDANYLSTAEDAETLLAGARYLRRLAATPALKAVIAEELKPGPRTQDDDALVADIRQRAYSVFHPCGTCRMGPDPATAVVDHRLKVHGLGGLRVIDASIFPAITSGNINAPSMMVGVKGAELVLGDA